MVVWRRLSDNMCVIIDRISQETMQHRSVMVCFLSVIYVSMTQTQRWFSFYSRTNRVLTGTIRQYLFLCLLQELQYMYVCFQRSQLFRACSPPWVTDHLVACRGYVCYPRLHLLFIQLGCIPSSLPSHFNKLYHDFVFRLENKRMCNKDPVETASSFSQQFMVL